MWREQNKFFVKTKAVDYVLDILKDNATCTVIGSPGIGKSATIHHIALYLRDTKGYFIIPIHGPSDIEKYFVENKKQMFVIDDVCGRFNAIQTDIEEWFTHMHSINIILSKGNVKLLASCRLQVFNDAQFQHLKCFTNNICDLSTEHFQMSNEQKIQVALQYLPEHIVDVVKNLFDQYEILPFMFTLFRSLQEKHIAVDAESYFKDPFETYRKEIDEIRIKDKTKYCALFMFVVHNGKIDEAIFINELEKASESEKRKAILESCGIKQTTLRADIIEQLHSLVKLFVKIIPSDTNTKMYNPVHNKLFDFLCLYFGENMQIPFIKFVDINLLMDRTSVVEIEDLRSNVHEGFNEFTILINKENHNEYFERIAQEVIHGDCNAVLNSMKMHNKEYALQLFKHVTNQATDVTLESSRLQALFEKAITISDFGALTLFIDKGANVNIVDKHGDTPLILACQAGIHHQNVKLLTDRGANVNVVNKEGDTPLILACTHRYNVNSIKLLVDKGADVNVVNKEGDTPLIWACKHKFIDESIQLLLDKGANVNVVNKEGDTPLILACKYIFNDKTIKLLIDKGANVNVVNKEGDTPLILACTHHYNVYSIKLLVDKGANVNVVNKEGDTPLILACKHKYNDHSFKLLVDKGADVNVVNKEGDTPLILACKHKFDDESIKLLLDKGANVNVVNKEGDTPLILACTHRYNVNSIKLLIDKGANVNIVDKNGDTPLILACRAGIHDENVKFTSLKHNDNVNSIKLLLDKGADVNLVNREGDTPLTVTCRARINHNIVKLLIYRGADVNIVNKDGDTPLILVCKNPLRHRTEMYKGTLKLLIERGANVNAIDNNGMSSLMFACKLGYHFIVSCLIKAGASISVKSHENKTAYSFALESGHRNTIKLISESMHGFTESDSVGVSKEKHGKRQQNLDAFDNL